MRRARITISELFKTSEVEIGILLNFGKKPEVRRKVFSASFKNHNKSKQL